MLALLQKHENYTFHTERVKRLMAGFQLIHIFSTATNAIDHSSSVDPFIADVEETRRGRNDRIRLWEAKCRTAYYSFEGLQRDVHKKLNKYMVCQTATSGFREVRDPILSHPVWVGKFMTITRCNTSATMPDERF